MKKKIIVSLLLSLFTGTSFTLGFLNKQKDSSDVNPIASSDEMKERVEEENHGGDLLGNNDESSKEQVKEGGASASKPSVNSTTTEKSTGKQGTTSVSNNNDGKAQTNSKQNTNTSKPNNSTANNSNTSTGGTESQGDYLARVEEEIFTATNNERAKNGLKPFNRNSTANGYARSKSLEMLNLNYFDHNSPNNGTIMDIAKRDGWKYSRIGENIYTMSGYAANDVNGTSITNGWMNSPGHRANILNSSFTDIGIGVTFRNGKAYATQIFYTPM